MLRKVKQLLSNFEAERWENLSNLRLAKKSVAYKKNSSVLGHLMSQLAVNEISVGYTALTLVTFFQRPK